MATRIIEIAGERRAIARKHGFLTISHNTVELGSEPLDDLAAVIVTGRGTTYSHGILVALAEKNVPLIICNANFLPVSWLWPVAANHIQARRMAAQVAAKKPLGKQLWQLVVKSKLAQQADTLKALGKSPETLHNFIPKVKSGDPDNIEGQAAKYYWHLLFGPEFRRSRHGPAPNPTLNYGYTVLRALVARAVAAAGLHPSLGIHHRNQYDHLQLADDLMEPFRPSVDYLVAKAHLQGAAELTPEHKQALASLPVKSTVALNGTKTPLFNAVVKLAVSIAQSFEEGRPNITLPGIVTQYQPSMLTTRQEWPIAGEG